MAGRFSCDVMALHVTNFCGSLKAGRTWRSWCCEGLESNYDFGESCKITEKVRDAPRH